MSDVEFTPPASQEDLNRIISDRLSRQKEKLEKENAEKFADYDDLKAKASSLDEIEEARKSELQKATERAEAAEKAVAERAEVDAKREAEEKAKRELAEVRDAVAKEKGVDASVLRGGSREDLEAHADSIKSLIGSSSVVSKSGTGGDSLKVSSLDAGRDLYNSKHKKSS